MRCGKNEHQPGQKCPAKNAKCKACQDWTLSEGMHDHQKATGSPQWVALVQEQVQKAPQISQSKAP